MITKNRRGLKEAIEYLKSAMPVRLITDRLYLLANCDGKVESLGYSLRREARKPDNTNRVNVSYSPDGSGRDVAYYTFNTDYKPPERPVKAPTRPKALYFYTKALRGLPSPYYLTLEAVHVDIHHAKLANPGLDGFHIWSGTTEAPVFVGVVK